jgi:hypothetical protein
MTQPVQGVVQAPFVTVPKVTVSLGVTVPRLPHPSLNVKFSFEGIGVLHFSNVSFAGSVEFHFGPVVFGTVIVCE